MSAPGLDAHPDGLQADRAATMRSLLGPIREHVDPRFDEEFDGRTTTAVGGLQREVVGAERPDVAERVAGGEVS